MIDLFLVFWTLMIFLSIAWYGFLLFYVGFKGGKEIRILTKTLGDRKSQQDTSGSSSKT
jgi:hypothetical protein